jgi:glycosyltransferase involved in cell wall biosynthesis
MSEAAMPGAPDVVELPTSEDAFRNLVTGCTAWVPLITHSPRSSPTTLATDMREHAQLRQAASLCEHAVVTDEQLRSEVVRFGFEDVRLLGPEYPLSLGGPESPSLIVAGPADGSYSLAIVNREVADALRRETGWRVGLAPLTGAESTPYQPDDRFLTTHPEVRARICDARRIGTPDVVIGNSWPPPFYAMTATTRWLYFFWEESRVPDEVMEGILALDGVLAPSSFVRDTLRANGYTGAAPVVGTGVVAPLSAVRAPLRRRRRHSPLFTFLHVSSGQARKGLDVLLDAYGRAFSASDPVQLVLRVAPEHQIEQQVLEFLRSRGDAPRVVLETRDLPRPLYYSLFERSHCFVSATRGEGFGLPAAEAMLFGLPVIITGFGGQSDFCTDETAWLIDYALQPAKTHFGLEGSLWAEPDPEHLASLMHRAFDRPDGLDVRAMTARAADLIRADYSWKAVARRVARAVAPEAFPAGTRNDQGATGVRHS